MQIKKDGSILLDFGTELHGGVCLVLRDAEGTGYKGSKVHICFGESATEAMSRVGTEANATNDHAVRDFDITVPMYGSIEIGNTGFTSNDDRLNKIWETAVYTVHLNMQNYLWDGIKRDRMIWIGDMHPETSTIQKVFGYDSCVPESLDFVKNDYPSDSWMNTIASYSIWWIIIHRDWRK